MNRSECRALLTREGVPEDAFDLNGGRNNETYTIGETSHGKWYFYDFERGNEVEKRNFGSESEGMRAFGERDPACPSD